MGQITYTEKTRAFIKVQDGCNQFCSYCIIPYARGRVRSRNAESIIKEITQIAQNGIKEVVITGIHVASYGRDFENENGLIELLEKINEIEGIKRIRLGSLEPKIITEEWLNSKAKSARMYGKLCKFGDEEKAIQIAQQKLERCKLEGKTKPFCVQHF